MATRRTKGRSPSPKPPRSPSPKPPTLPRRSPPRAAKPTYVYILRRVEEGEGQDTHTFSVKTAVYSTAKLAVSAYIALMVGEYESTTGPNSYEARLKGEGVTVRMVESLLMGQLKGGEAELDTDLDNVTVTIRRVVLDAPIPTGGAWGDDVIQ
jgi:hypothetical protein